MASPKSQALTRKADMELMPPPPTKRIKRPATVLDEDTYTSALSSIIARDFFPGLVEAQHQQEYLDALDSHDSAWIAEASRKLTEVMTSHPRRRGTSFTTPRLDRSSSSSSSTPNLGAPATPATPTSGTDDEEKKKPEVDTNMSLDSFQARYTSEDNESFNSILDAQNAKRRSAYAFLWNGNRIPGFRGKAAAARQKALEAQEHAAKKRRLLSGETTEADEAAAAAAAGKAGEQKLLTAPDTRPAVPNTWTVKEPKNGLMFTPDTSPPPAPLSERDAQLPPKGISHANTRLPPEPPAAPSRAASPSSTLIRDALAGRPRASASEAGGGASGFAVAETPRVNGYSFVADAPSPSPSELGAPPLTWGSVAALASTDRAAAAPNPGPSPSPFKIAATPRREALHLRMVEKVARSHRPASSLFGAARTPGAGAAKTPGSAAGAGVKMTPLGGAGKGREVPSFKSSPALTPAGERLWSTLRGARKDTGLREALAKRGSSTRETPKPGGRGFRWTPTPMAGRK